MSSRSSARCIAAMLLLAAAVVILALAAPGSRESHAGEAELTPAPEFRVENRVYIADDTAPASSSVTLFASDAVYDFLDDTSETTIFDEKSGRIVLMSPLGEIRTEWQTQQLAQYTAQFKKWAAKQKDPLLRFLAAPKFEENRGRAGKTVKLSSRMLVYDVTTERPDNAAVAQRYAEFSDWFAQLNLVRNRGDSPPFARMELNGLLGQVGVLPVEVRKRLTPTKGKPQRLRSTHEITWSLSAADRRRIEEARQQLASLKAVEQSEYERLAEKTNGRSKRR